VLCRKHCKELDTGDTLIIRADASVAIATGHVMRCLALAQAWQDAGGNVVFAIAESTPAIETLLRSEGMEIVHLEVSPNSVQDAQDVSALACGRQATWIVVDGYRFDSDYQRNLKNAGLKLLFMDDLGQCEHYFADLVLNQNVHANEFMYADRKAHTRLLLGPRFAMLRRDFRRWRKWDRDIAPKGRKVLVTMGGSDPDNVTALVLEALRAVEIDGLEVIAVLGGSNPHTDFLTTLVNQSPPIRFLRDATNMPELMAWADVAVSAAGSTCGEMCLLGLPAILLDLAENQTPVAQELGRRRAAIHLGSSKEVTAAEIAAKVQSLLLSTEHRVSLSQASRVLVDGDGAAAGVFVSRAPQFRGRGYGQLALKMATEDLFRMTATKQIDAYVKPNNTASLRLFARAGYARVGVETVRSHQAIHFVLQRVVGDDRPQHREDVGDLVLAEKAETT